MSVNTTSDNHQPSPAQVKTQKALGLLKEAIQQREQDTLIMSPGERKNNIII